jgi:KDO2-lipid IV(A) lauroyltransferase
MVEYLTLIVVKLLAITLPWPTLYWLAIRVAWLNYRLSRRSKAGIRSNLRVILGEEAGEKEIDKVAKDAFTNFGKSILEFFGFSRMGTRFLEDRVKVLGIENIDEAISQGRGVIAVSAHLSNTELGAVKLVDAGYPVTGVALDHERESVNRLFTKQRARKGIKAYSLKRGGRHCLEALRRNELVCLVGDRDLTGTGIEIDYFGRPAKFPVGPARLCLATGAPIVPAFMIRQPDNTFELIFEDPIHPREDGDRNELVSELTSAYARVCEKYVGAYPEQFANFFPIWDE